MNTDPTPIVSRVLPDGTLLETVYDSNAGTTTLAIGEPDGATRLVPHFDGPDGVRLVPYSPGNNLLTTGCVLLPSDIGELGDKGEMVAAIRDYLARYVDLSPAFMDIVPYYVLLSWVYDAFNELPYLRVRGDYGTGKTRALITIGSICYKPFFASGASTVSPIFHILDGFRGTLVLDEADFRFSEMTGDLTKVLNNGSVNGLPVLRTMTNRHRELNPQAFRVFGPKILAMRESFADRALESRFFTEETGRRPPPPHIPIHTPNVLTVEARELRNRLLAWRLSNRCAIAPQTFERLPGGNPRLDQMAVALLSLVDDEATRGRIIAHLTGEAERGREEKRETDEGRMVAALVEAFEGAARPSVSIAALAERFNSLGLERFHIPISNKAVGHIVREKLGIRTTKFHGTYGIGQEERQRVYELACRLGIPHTRQARESVSPIQPAGAADFHASNERP